MLAASWHYDEMSVSYGVWGYILSVIESFLQNRAIKAVLYGDDTTAYSSIQTSDFFDRLETTA